uniref:HEAT repeat domain-containing protein n=1 Tax=Roseihalotalea indica TaxID=2867963 RepID=A0AA49GIM0_9BACT|nr:HEAT repeat domain-containing protein [Tunicatimonas sp. TK19036]
MIVRKTLIYTTARLIGFLLLATATFQCTSDHTGLTVHQGDHIILVGNNLGSRMMNFGHFETEMQLRYPDSLLFIRNMCDGGNTPGFRPHSGRESPWAFEGAEKFQTELAHETGSEGHFESPDEWITRLEADIIVAFFGYNESFQGQEGVENYKAELDAFIKHTLSQNYNGKNPPQLAIVSPIAFENLSDQHDLPDGTQENANLSLYTEAMKEVAANNNVLFADVFTPTKEWFEPTDEALTIDGFQMTDEGYARFAPLLADKVFGEVKTKAEENRNLVHAAVMEKNWMWHNDFKIPNGVHVFGRRYDPFGPDNYPAELEKIREMTALRDEAIWKANKGEKMNLTSADQQTKKLPPVETNYKPSDKNGTPEYLYGQEALDKLHVAPGYKIDLFASEEEFTDLANPVQISFDNKGRLWVATMPSYPHYKPGDSKPNDKLIILEDTDQDGKADKQTVFLDSLHLPTGFELAPEGVYVSQGTNLMLFTDTDGDDHADKKTILLSGFDDHDTHHAHGAYTADPSGAIYMGEGVFLHTNVETPYGPVRATNGGFYRYNPQRHRLERTAQLSIPNPWGIAFDEWGQNFFADTSGPDVRWMMPGTMKSRYGVFNPKPDNLIEEAHRVRPTSGLEFVSSRHFPDDVQGDLLINNTIGFLGTKQHTMVDDGTGFHSEHRQDLVWGEDKNFRPVDMEFAPDGSLYLVDWHNVLIGHMQHNARDPLRDHVHGRIYRITYPSRPLVEPAKVAGASISELLDNLKLPEFRTRYRTRRELRGHDPKEVQSNLYNWVDNLDQDDPRYEHHLLEALWVTWGLNQVDESLLRQLLQSEDFHVRAAAVRVLRFTGHQVEDQPELLMEAARDEHGRVRLEAITAASWLDKEEGLPIVQEAGKMPLDEWMAPAYETALAHLEGHEVGEKKEEAIATNLKGAERDMFIQGKAIYEREGFCSTCHQPDGAGLATSGFPPLQGTEWVNGDEERLIKVVLNGLMGPIEVLDKEYPGQVPMTPFKGMLNDDEVAAVLTYVRNSFGNEAPAISPELVKEVRASTDAKAGFYSPEELLSEHPMDD